MSCCVQAMAHDVCSICTNAKLTYAREWQEAPTLPQPCYIATITLPTSPSLAIWVQVPRWMVD